MNTTANEFLKTVRLAFPVFQGNEKRFFRDLESSVDAYAEQHPNCSIADLNEQFGQPREIVDTYFDNMETSVYFCAVKRAHQLKIMSYAIIIFLLLMIAITLGFLWQAKTTYRDATAYQTNTTIKNIYYMEEP